MKPGTRAVLELLTAAGPEGITPLDALREASCFRLAARVAELRGAGYDIATTWETDGEGTRWARYLLVEEQPPTFAPITGVQEGLAL
jgi:hypothetical protein